MTKYLSEYSCVISIKIKKAIAALLFFIVIFQSAGATNYYFSSVSGDDARTATQAQNSATPWKTISQLNSFFPSLKAGDFIFFKRGETFYGSINVTASGSSSLPITIGAYGTGAKPVITGFVSLTNWVSVGSGKFESYNASFGDLINMFTINDISRAYGRYPNSNAANKGYLTFESHGTSSITDNELSSSTNWTGAELVIRTHHWILDRVKVSSHSGNTVSYTGKTTRAPINGYGYFFQNDIRALDQFGEWCYKPSTKKVSVYFGTTTPSTYNIKASVIKYLVDVYNRDNIVFDNLAFTGANELAINIYSADNIQIKNCDILFSGKTAINSSLSNSLKIENCQISYSNNMGLDLYNGSNTSIIRNNTIKNIGILAGMGSNGDHSLNGVKVNGDNHILEYNSVDSIGYCGIRFIGNGVTIKNNLISNFALVKDDAGGIYTGSSDGAEKFGRKIIGNIVLNGIGAKEGTTATTVQQVSGIYLDNNSSGITITGNTVTNCGKMGLYVHNSYNLIITGNTLYNNTAQTMLNRDDLNMAAVKNVTLKNNIFFSKTATQPVAYYYTKLNDIATFGTIDSNYYARPMDDNLSITGITGLYTGSTQITTKYTLDTWKLKYGKDKASKKSPKIYPITTKPDDVIRFEYNASNVNKTITLSGSYIDVKNKSYSNSVTLAPYSSIILMKTTAPVNAPNLSPTVYITSPVNNATYSAPANIQLAATATDADGTISKVDFYHGSTLIVTEKLLPYSWAWQNVPAGSYTITAKATDNSGNVTTSAAITITVKAQILGSASGSNSELASMTDMVPNSQIAEFKVFPNPVVTNIKIEFNPLLISQKANLSIRNSNGSLIKNIPLTLFGNFTEVNLSSLIPGIYVLTLSGKDFIISKKIVKK